MVAGRGLPAATLFYFCTKIKITIACTVSVVYNGFMVTSNNNTAAAAQQGYTYLVVYNTPTGRKYKTCQTAAAAIRQGKRLGGCVFLCQEAK